MAQQVKNPPARAGDTGGTGSGPGSGRFPGGGDGNPLQYSYLKNPTDRGDCRLQPRVTKSRMHTHTHTHTHTPHTSMKWGLLIRPRGPGQVTCRGRPGRKRSWHHTSVPGHSSTLVWSGRAAQGLLQPKAGFPFSHCAQRGFPHRG